jgi:DNA repair exonuclease SbcCD ATPase subunit
MVRFQDHESNIPMIKSISLENFMSHQAARIDLAPGVTVITGPNNVGKSAVVEAVRSLVQNCSQKHSIRHGAKQAVVRLELDSGEVIEWVRTDKTAYYRLLRPRANDREGACEPEEYRKIGLTVPEDIRALLRLGLVETESGDIDIHIGNQREPIFLLNSPGSHAAGFFAASTEAEYLLRMRQALKRKVDFSKTTRKVLEAESQTQEEALRRYQPLDSIEPDLQHAERIYTLICDHQKSLPELSEFIEILADKGRTLDKQQQSAALFEGLGLPPELPETTGLEALLQHWRQTAGKAGVAAARFQALKPLSSHPPLEETVSLASLTGWLTENEKLLEQRRQEKESLSGLAEPSGLAPVSDLKNLAEAIRRQDLALATNRGFAGVFQDMQGLPVISDVLPFEQLIADLYSREELKNRAQQQHENLALLTAPADLADVDDLLGLIANLSRLDTQKRHFEGVSGTLGILATVPEMTTLLDLEALVSQTQRVMQELSQKQHERDSLEQALEQKCKEVEELISAAGLCPLCGSPMDVAHFLGAMHG